MSGYIGINLRDILFDEILGENVAKKLLSSFSCPLNPDVEHFLKHTAIEFFGTRELDRDETANLTGESLVQMLKYM